eukprot:SAG11_NODE_750_length_7360_cov_7.329522_12_plen_89_part_00
MLSDAAMHMHALRALPLHIDNYFGRVDGAAAAHALPCALPSPRLAPNRAADTDAAVLVRPPARPLARPPARPPTCSFGSSCVLFLFRA